MLDEGANRVRLKIGPLSSCAARAWLAYANEALDQVIGVPLPFAVPAEVVSEFRSYLDAWSTAANGLEFIWSGEVEAARARTLMTYWLNIAQFMADGKIASRPIMTADAEGFYEALVEAILAALAAEEPVARVIDEQWPWRAEAVVTSCD